MGTGIAHSAIRSIDREVNCVPIILSLMALTGSNPSAELLAQAQTNTFMPNGDIALLFILGGLLITGSLLLFMEIQEETKDKKNH